MTMRLSTSRGGILPPDPSCNLTCFARRNKPASQGLPSGDRSSWSTRPTLGAREVDDEFMLGDDLLVAPVGLRVSTSESSTFPTDSGWTCTPTAAHRTKVVVVYPDLNVVPLFATAESRDPHQDWSPLCVTKRRLR